MLVSMTDFLTSGIGLLLSLEDLLISGIGILLSLNYFQIYSHILENRSEVTIKTQYLPLILTFVHEHCVHYCTQILILNISLKISIFSNKM